MNFPSIPGSLLEYGVALVELDSICLNVFVNNHLNTHFPTGMFPGVRAQDIRDLSEPDAKSISAQFHEVSIGRQQLNLYYLENPKITGLWKSASQWDGSVRFRVLRWWKGGKMGRADECVWGGLDLTYSY